MKLLAKNMMYLILFSSLIFLAGGYIFYINLRTQIYQEIDQSLTLEKDRIIQKLMLADTIPVFYTNFENQIRVATKEKEEQPYVRISDTLIYDSIEKDYIPFRKLESLIFLYTKAYRIDVSKSLINKGELISDVLLLMVCLFLALLVIMLAVYFFISRNLLKPFYSTLGVIKNYKVTREAGLTLPKTRIKEFTMLNEVLNIMSQKIHSDFLSLKEFTENASHEMQTPLTIIKAKLELIIQNENLTLEQMRLLQGINDSASKLSKMSRALVLISRIENMQFRETRQISINQLLNNLLENFAELMAEKKITLEKQFTSELIVSMSPALAEILLTNLLSNAIKHNVYGGTINIIVKDPDLIITNTGHPLKVNPANLFHRFSKESAAPDSIGLGLAVVKKIADANHLQIDYSCLNDIHTLHLKFVPQQSV